MPELTSAGLFKEWCPVRGEAWSVAIILSERAPWPRPGRGAWSPDRRGACVEAAAGPDGHCARVSLRTADVGRTALPRRYHSCMGPAGPGRAASPSTWGTAATTSPVGPGPEGSVGPPRPMRANRSRELRSRGRGGLGRAGPGDRPRGSGEDLLSRVAGADAANLGWRDCPREGGRHVRQGAQVPGPGSAGALTGWCCGTLPAPPACRYRVGLRRMTVGVRSRKGLM